MEHHEKLYEPVIKVNNPSIFDHAKKSKRLSSSKNVCMFKNIANVIGNYI